MNWPDRVEERAGRKVIRRAQASGVRKPTLRRRLGIDAFDLARLVILAGFGLFFIIAGIVLWEIALIALGLVVVGGLAGVHLVAQWLRDKGL